MHFLKKTKEKIDGQKVIFHASQIEGLKTIKPNKCKHEKAYVYASLNLPLCVIFSVKRKGENVAFGVSKFGVPFIEEFYPGAFEDRFKNQSTYIYKLPQSYFQNETEYLEMVSTSEVPVLDVLKIDNCADYLLTLAKKKQLKLYRYESMSKKHKEQVHNKLVKALKKYLPFNELSKTQFDKLSDFDKKTYLSKKERYDNCWKKFPELMESIKSEIENK